MSKTLYLSLGSNVGDREQNLRDAISRLGSVGDVTSVSSFYETEPVEVTNQPCFVNCAVAVETAKAPQEVMAMLLGIEEAMGRRRGANKGPRIIDVDILLFDDTVVNAPSLTIPHPAMQERRFVLEPLAEIAPGARHPVLKRTVRELLDGLPAGQVVRKLRKKRPGIARMDTD